MKAHDADLEQVFNKVDTMKKAIQLKDERAESTALQEQQKKHDDDIELHQQWVANLEQHIEELEAEYVHNIEELQIKVAEL